MSDFVSNEPVEIEVVGRKFKVKEVSGELYDKMSEKFILIDQDGGINIDIAKRSKELLSLVVEAPDDYSSNGKKFPELSVEERLEILQKMKPGLRDKLIGAINGTMKVDEDLKKK